jgi:hypothetical protein
VGSEDSLDLADALGAEREASSQVLSVYIPNKDRRGNEFDAAPWVKEAAELLFRIGEGATVTPPHDGVTADEAGAPQWEKTVIVYTYVTDALRGELPRLRSFLHRFGRETNQREVGVELSGGGEGWFFRIKKFDAA